MKAVDTMMRYPTRARDPPGTSPRCARIQITPLKMIWRWHMKQKLEDVLGARGTTGRDRDRVRGTGSGRRAIHHDVVVWASSCSSVALFLWVGGGWLAGWLAGCA